MVGPLPSLGEVNQSASIALIELLSLGHSDVPMFHPALLVCQKIITF